MKTPTIANLQAEFISAKNLAEPSEVTRAVMKFNSDMYKDIDEDIKEIKAEITIVRERCKNLQEHKTLKAEWQKIDEAAVRTIERIYNLTTKAEWQEIDEETARTIKSIYNLTTEIDRRHAIFNQILLKDLPVAASLGLSPLLTVATKKIILGMAQAECNGIKQAACRGMRKSA